MNTTETDSELKTYRVRVEYHSIVTTEVEATCEEEAIEFAKDQTQGNEIAVNAEIYEATARKKKPY